MRMHFADIHCMFVWLVSMHSSSVRVGPLIHSLTHCFCWVPGVQETDSGRLCVFAIDTSNNKIKGYTATDASAGAWSLSTTLDASDDTYVRRVLQDAWLCVCIQLRQ